MPFPIKWYKNSKPIHDPDSLNDMKHLTILEKKNYTTSCKHMCQTTIKK